MIMAKGRSYSTLTIKKLYALSGNNCSFPGCTVKLLNNVDDKNLSNICHIEDANQSTHQSDRYNSNMTDKERSGYDNLILLCPNHHVETNDPKKYTVEGLRKMKKDHETSVEQLSLNNNQMAKYPSLLSDLINLMGTSLLENSVIDMGQIEAPNTADKISYNKVIRYKERIKEYSVYQGKLNAIYEEVERQGSNKKSILLDNIRLFYLDEKKKYNSIKEIQANSDLIIEEVNKRIWNVLEKSSNLDTSLPFEVINIGVLIIIVDAFMRCKILEEPQNHDSE